MSLNPKPSPDPQEDSWIVYIVKCRDGSLYTGITNDVARRIAQHNEGTASRYTRSRRPVELCYTERRESRSSALIRECSVRLLSRKEKEMLIAAHSSSGVDSK